MSSPSIRGKRTTCTPVRNVADSIRRGVSGGRGSPARAARRGRPIADRRAAEGPRERALTYEVVHLITALTWVVRMRARGDHGSPTHNLCVEGCCSTRGRWPTPYGLRVQARRSTCHRLPSTWERLATLHGDLRDRINRQVPHLTTRRLGKQGFDLAGIAGDVLRGVIKFVEQVAAERREWFAQAEQLPGRHSPSSLQRRPARGSVAADYDRGDVPVCSSR